MATDITIGAAIGRAANRRGAGTENALEGMHRIYRAEGRAIIDRQNVATRGKPTSRFICGRAPVDFGGVLRSGRAVFAEVKTTGKAKTALAFDDRGVRSEQVTELAARGRMGALAVLLWRNGDRLGVALWDAIDGFHLTRKSIPQDAFVWLEPLAFDWLPVAVGAEGKNTARASDPAPSAGVEVAARAVRHRGETVASGRKNEGGNLCG